MDHITIVGRFEKVLKNFTAKLELAIVLFGKMKTSIISNTTLH